MMHAKQLSVFLCLLLKLTHFAGSSLVILQALEVTLQAREEVSGRQFVSEFPQPLRGTYFHPERIIGAQATPAEQAAAIQKALDRMQVAGLNAIFPYFTGSSGQAYYRGRIHKVRVYGDRDPLGELLQQAARRGLRVYPVICVTVCGHEKPAGILEEHPDWALRHPDGAPLGYISPAHPDARKWLAGVAAEIVRLYRPDGILLDYIRYHNRPLQLDPAADRRFRELLPFDASPDQEKRLMQQFKEDELTELVRLYRSALDKESESGMYRLGIYSWGPHVAAGHQIAQCWPRWVAESSIDFVNVSGYYHKDKYGEKYLKMFNEKMVGAGRLNMETGRPVPLSFAVGLVTSHGRVHSADDVRTYLRSAAEARLDGYVMFTWGDLLPWLDELDQQQDLTSFPAYPQGPAPQSLE